MDIPSLRYEDMVDNPDTVIPKLLALVDIPPSYSSKAAQALTNDSQELSEISQAKLRHVKTYYAARFKPTGRLLEHMEAEYQAAGVPPPI